MLRMASERLFALSDRALIRDLPRRRRGRRPHVSTLYRWAMRGLRGVRLETICVGGTLCTSREAVLRFFEALTQQRQTHAKGPTVSSQAQADAVNKQLDALHL